MTARSQVGNFLLVHTGDDSEYDIYIPNILWFNPINENRPNSVVHCRIALVDGNSLAVKETHMELITQMDKYSQ